MDDLGGKPTIFGNIHMGRENDMYYPSSKTNEYKNELPWHLLMKLMIFGPFLTDGFQATCGWLGYFGWSKFTPRPCNGVRCELRIHAQYYLQVRGKWSKLGGIGFG